MPRGRPTKYSDRYPAMAFMACAEMGATNRQLARLFGVGSSTLDRWIARHADFRGAIKRGKAQFDTEVVERALLKLALGYRYTEETRTPGEQGLELTKAVQKQTPPNTKAQIFWLSNRAPGRWKRKVEGVHDTGGDLAERLAEAKERARRGAGP